MNATCPQCGHPVPANTVRGLCPKCLALLALGGSPEKTIAISPSQLEAALDPNLHYFGDYELLEEIARGGMGVVFKARQTSLKRIVAVKMILSGQLAGEAEIRRFHLEAEAAAALQHPNIVAIHEVGQHQGRHYFSMDYVEGRNLAEVIGAKPMPAATAAQILKTVAEAVHFAHQRGTLHRDLKPQNILIDSAGQPRITDFGLAKRAQSDVTLTQTGAIMGSPSYMSPEQALGRQDLIGPATDVYALGAVLYEMLTGKKAFAGESAASVLSDVINKDPTSPRKLNPAAPADLETICLKCLDKKAERRYPSARALAEDLDRYLRHEPIQARPVPAWRKVASNIRRRPWAVVGLATALILALLLVIDYLFEETRYLVWQSVHPGVTLAPDYTWLTPLQFCPCLICVFFSFFYESRRHGVSFTEYFNNARKYLALVPTRPPRFGLAFTSAVLGTLAILCSLCVCVLSIRAYVWGHHFNGFGFFAGVCCTCWLGGLLLWEGIRHMAAAKGRIVLPEDNPQLITPAQLQEIASAIETQGMLEAIRLYRKTTGVGLGPAEAAVRELAGKLYAEHPERFPYDPRRPAPLDPRRAWPMVGAALVLLVATYFVLGPRGLAPALSELSAALAGFVSIWAQRWKNPQRLCLGMPKEQWGGVLLGVGILVAILIIMASPYPHPRALLTISLFIGLGLAALLPTVAKKA